MRLKPLLFSASTMALFALPAFAGEGFSPTDKCNEILTGASPATKIMAASWMIGYVDSGVADVRKLDLAEIERLLNVLGGLCGANPDDSLLAVAQAAVQLQNNRDVELQASNGAAPAASDGESPGSQAAARALLEQFVVPGADLVALTRPLIASADDIRAVYKEPLASAMIEVYRDKLPANIAIRPKPGQSEILIWHTTTDDLMAGSDMLDNFPGGYRRVTEFMNPGYPLVRFKFVAPGQELGMAYDGLFWVNDHWAWMPKPWRMLP